MLSYESNPKWENLLWLKLKSLGLQDLITWLPPGSFYFGYNLNHPNPKVLSASSSECQFNHLCHEAGPVEDTRLISESQIHELDVGVDNDPLRVHVSSSCNAPYSYQDIKLL